MGDASADNSTVPPAPLPSSAPPAPLRWRSWPLCESLVRSLLLSAGLLLTAVIVYGSTGRLLWGLAAVVALAAALWRFFLPMEFELGKTGLRRRVFGRERLIAWQAVGGYSICASGVLLLPEKDDAPIAPLRGLYVPWSTHRNEVLALLRYYIELPKEKSTVNVVNRP